ncbi:hypothetical protein DFJ74DRAFT_650772, partial [Hyaloraphidium curvatum]
MISVSAKQGGATGGHVGLLEVGRMFGRQGRLGSGGGGIVALLLRLLGLGAFRRRRDGFGLLLALVAVLAGPLLGNRLLGP